jgi:hypothetical protein
MQNTEAALKALRERYPDWDIHQVFGGWEAVPAGTGVIRAIWLESLEEKLAAQEAAKPRV